MAIHPELFDYIKKARVAGMGDAEIRSELLKIGWKAEDIDDAILPPPPPPKPVSTPQASVPGVPVTVAHSTPTKIETGVPKERRSHALFFITVFLLVLIGGAIYYALPQIVAKLEGISPVVLPLTEENNLVRDVLPIDDPASRLTYRNEEYGFEFEYPANWNYTANLREAQFLVCLNPNGPFPGDCHGLFTVSWDVGFQEKLAGAMEVFKDAGGEITEMEIVVDGVVATLLNIELPGGFTRNALWEKGGYIFSFVTIDGDELVFDQIFSSLKFFSQATSTTL